MSGRSVMASTNSGGARRGRRRGARLAAAALPGCTLAGVLLLGGTAWAQDAGAGSSPTAAGAAGSQTTNAPKPATQMPLSQGTSTTAGDEPGQAQPSGARATAPSESSPAAQAVEDQTQSAVAHPGVLLDRVVAVVNGDVILESDLTEEQRLAAFQPITDPSENVSKQKALARLIDRRLLLQQAKLQPQKPVTDAEVDARIQELRRVIPACKAAHCETEAGWKAFLSSHGVTAEELEDYWLQRLETLQFVELRFRTGLRITPAQIKDYYTKTMLPEYAKQGVAPPKLDTISDRIQSVLLEQQVSGLLSDWLNSLRAQGSVQIVADGVLPS